MAGNDKTTGVICFLRVDKKGIMGYYVIGKNDLMLRLSSVPMNLLSGNDVNRTIQFVKSLHYSNNGKVNSRCFLEWKIYGST